MRAVFEDVRAAYRAARKEDRIETFDDQARALIRQGVPRRDLAAFDRALRRQAFGAAASASAPVGEDGACWEVICSVRVAIGDATLAPSPDRALLVQEARDRFETDLGHAEEIELCNDPPDDDPPVASGLSF